MNCFSCKPVSTLIPIYIKAEEILKISMYGIFNETCSENIFIIGMKIMP